MRALVIAVGIIAAAAPALAQTAPAPSPAQALQKGLFGEREPGDDEEAEGAAQPTSPEAPPAGLEGAPSTRAYDSRVRQSYAAAESFQGRLDGGWLASNRGRDLLQLQLVDKGKGVVEGAWGDLQRGASPNASGLLGPTPLAGGGLDVSFADAGGLKYRLRLRASPDGRWAGTLARGDEVFDVTLRRAP